MTDEAKQTLHEETAEPDPDVCRRSKDEMRSENAWSRGYKTVMVADPDRDGVALELWRTVVPGDELIAEAFLDDGSETIATRTFESSLGESILDQFLTGWLFGNAAVELMGKLDQLFGDVDFDRKIGLRRK